MSTISQRNVTVQFSGDVNLTEPLVAAQNSASPGSVQAIALAVGANTITPPAGATAVSIQKPAGNVSALTLKGVSGDTGIPLHLTDPDSISLSSSAAFVINASAIVTIRLFWT